MRKKATFSPKNCVRCNCEFIPTAGISKYCIDCKAIVDKEAGVTRDRHYGKCEWCGKTFSVIDTGGYTTNSDDVFESEIRKQVLAAIEEADVIMFMCDVDTGITDYDEEIADIGKMLGEKENAHARDFENTHVGRLVAA